MEKLKKKYERQMSKKWYYEFFEKQNLTWQSPPLRTC